MTDRAGDERGYPSASAAERSRLTVLRQRGDRVRNVVDAEADVMDPLAVLFEETGDLAVRVERLHKLQSEAAMKRPRFH